MNELILFEREFELRFLKARGTAFQDLFSDVMERAFGSDFVRIRPHGRLGDLKCDGYRTSDATVFQVYGPDDLRRIATLLAKIRDDFAGAQRHWGTRMSRWVFVHNSQTGLPAPAVQLFGELATVHQREIEPWCYVQLLGIVRSLPTADLHGLLPLPSGAAVEARLPRLATMQRYWTSIARREYPALKMTACLQRVRLPIRLITPEADRTERAFLEEMTKPRTTYGYFDQTSFSPSLQDRFDVIVRREHRRHPKLLILGDSGGGKTTLLRRLAHESATRLLGRGIRKRSRRTPVLVELWRFGAARAIKELLLASIAESDSGIRAADVDRLLERGCLMLLLDGLDEVGPELRQECLAQIGQLSQAFPRCRFVVSSRQIPSLPRDYGVLTIGMLGDEQIAAAVGVFLPRGDLRFDEYRTVEEYVRLMLRPSLRTVCRRPLALAFVLSTLDKNGTLPKNLYQAYEQILRWMLTWDLERDDLGSALAVDEVLQEVAYGLSTRDAPHVPVTEWLALAEPAVQRTRSLGTTEGVLRRLGAIGFLRFNDGNVGFAHRSVQEFLAARCLMSRGAEPHLDPLALQTGIAAFLCCALPDSTKLLERHLERCSDVEQLFPLLDECLESESESGRFEDIRNAMVIGYDMGIHITHSTDGARAATFIDDVEFLVLICVEVGSKATSVLTAAMHGIVFSVMWKQILSWLECIANGLEQVGWEGHLLLRGFLKLGYYEHGEWIFYPRDKGGDRPPETPKEFMDFFAADLRWFVPAYWDELVETRGQLARGPRSSTLATHPGSCSASLAVASGSSKSPSRSTQGRRPRSNPC